MNKAFILFICLGLSTVVLSQNSDGSFNHSDLVFDLEDFNLENSEETGEYEEEETFTHGIILNPDDHTIIEIEAEIGTAEFILEEEETFTDGIIINPEDFMQPHEFEDEPNTVEVVQEEEAEFGEFTEGIILNPDDHTVIEIEAEIGTAELVLEEEETFTDGIIINPEDFMQPHEFEDEPNPVEVVQEEEAEFGEFTEGIILNPDDHTVIEFEAEVGSAEFLLEEEETFTDGIMINPEDFMQPHEFEDDPPIHEIVEEEEEEMN